MSLIYPSYFPNIASCITIIQAKTICFELRQLPKQTFRNRCYIYGANGKLGLHIPVHYTQKSVKKQKIFEQITAPIGNRFIGNQLKVPIELPFFEFYEDDFESLFKNKSEWLMDYNFSV